MVETTPKVETIQPEQKIDIVLQQAFEVHTPAVPETIFGH